MSEQTTTTANQDKLVAYGLYLAYRDSGLSEKHSRQRLCDVLFLAPRQYPLEFVDQILSEIEGGGELECEAKRK